MSVRMQIIKRLEEELSPLFLQVEDFSETHRGHGGYKEGAGAISAFWWYRIFRGEVAGRAASHDLSISGRPDFRWFARNQDQSSDSD